MAPAVRLIDRWLRLDGSSARRVFPAVRTGSGDISSRGGPRAPRGQHPCTENTILPLACVRVHVLFISLSMFSKLKSGRASWGITFGPDPESAPVIPAQGAKSAVPLETPDLRDSKPVARWMRAPGIASLHTNTSTGAVWLPLDSALLPWITWTTSLWQ